MPGAAVIPGWLSSPWDGGERRWLRWGVLGVVAFDLVLQVVALTWGAVAEGLTGGAARLAHPTIRIGGGLALMAIGLLGVRAAGRPRGSLGGWLTALLALGLQSGLLTAVQAVPSRNLYASGAAIVGWVAGVLLARRLVTAPAPAAWEDAWGERGALTTVAATYAAAGLSKLSVFDAMGSVDLRATVLNHHRLADTSWAGRLTEQVVSAPRLADALIYATVVIQLGGLGMAVHRWYRGLWAALLICFHLSTEVLLHIIYLEHVLLLALFAAPWPALLPRLRAAPDATPVQVTPAAGRRALMDASVAAVLVVALAWGTPLRAPSAVGAVRPPPGTLAAGARRSIERWGPIARGDTLPGGWTVRSLRLSPGEVVMVTEREDGELVDWTVAATAVAQPAFFVRELSSTNTRLPFDQLAPAGRELATRLAMAAGPTPVATAWARWTAEATGAHPLPAGAHSAP